MYVFERGKVTSTLSQANVCLYESDAAVCSLVLLYASNSHPHQKEHRGESG